MANVWLPSIFDCGGSPNWQQNLPSWEKRFVTSVGSLSWKKFLEAKEFTHLYDNILKWDDSAGKEAFRDAKDRFYAKIHGLPCDVQLPKPDLFIDQVDWNSSEVDNDLVLELESDSVAPDPNCEREPVVIFGDAIPNPYQHYSPYGWGDSDDKMKKTSNDDNNGINWDDYVNKWDDWDVEPGSHWWVWSENNNHNKAEGDQGWMRGIYQAIKHRDIMEATIVPGGTTGIRGSQLVKAMEVNECKFQRFKATEIN
ncbi:hypothetical protein OSB04_001346, partial [Centaurea solstitialis]